jgi:hypothetical protein
VQHDGTGWRHPGSPLKETPMSTSLPPNSTNTERKKLTGLRMFLYFLAVLVVLALIGYVLWGSGETPANP